MLTCDRISVTVKASCGTKVERVKNTKKPISISANDTIIDCGDPSNCGTSFQCYESVIKSIANNPSVLAIPEWRLANILRDIFMTLNFEDLFALDLTEEDVETRIESHKLKQIKAHIFEKMKQAQEGSGVKVIFVDITGVEFPPEIKEAHVNVITAKANEIAAKHDANAKRTQIEVEGQARASHIVRSWQTS